MARLSGKDGKVMVGASPIANVTKWSYRRTSNNPAHADSGTAGWKTRVAGVKDSSGTIECWLDDTTGQTATLAPGTTLTLLLYQNGSKYWTVPAIIDEDGFETDIDDGGAIIVTFNFSGTGAPTPPSGF